MRKHLFRDQVSDADFRRAMHSLDVPFMEIIATRIGQSEGDTARHHELQNRISRLRNMPEIIDDMQENDAGNSIMERMLAQ